MLELLASWSFILATWTRFINWVKFSVVVYFTFLHAIWQQFVGQVPLKILVLATLFCWTCQSARGRKETKVHTHGKALHIEKKCWMKYDFLSFPKNLTFLKEISLCASMAPNEIIFAWFIYTVQHHFIFVGKTEI